MAGFTIGKLKKEELFPFAIGILAFCLPLLKGGIQIPIILSVVAWFFYPKRFSKVQLLLFLLLSGVYFFHILGMFFTENVSRGLADLEQKLSLLIFPLLFAFAIPISSDQRKNILRAFAGGTAGAIVISYATAAMAATATGDPMEFYMSNFSPVHHPSYIAMYIVFAIAIFLIEIEKTPDFHLREIGLWIAVLIFAITLIFPASKMGLLSFIMLAALYTLKRIFDGKFLSARTILTVVITLTFVCVLVNNPISGYRMQKAAEVAVNAEEIPAGERKESTAARMEAWRIAIDQMGEYPLGTGTGDINDVLVEEYEERGYSEYARMGLNPHNEFFQIALAQGIPAALFFILALLFVAYLGFVRRDWLLIFFLLLVIFNFLVESMLEKQSGVVFFAFFTALLVFSKHE